MRLLRYICKIPGWPKKDRCRVQLVLVRQCRGTDVSSTKPASFQESLRPFLIGDGKGGRRFASIIDAAAESAFVVTAVEDALKIDDDIGVAGE